MVGSCRISGTGFLDGLSYVRWYFYFYQSAGFSERWSQPFLCGSIESKEVLEQINKGHHCFVLFDELFRGTNARDAFEASVAVAEVLKAKAYSRFLISTHIIELARKLDGDDACCFYYLESAIVDDELICNHKVKPGISESRVGYWIVKKELAGFEK